jgi:hypothetical protein
MGNSGMYIKWEATQEGTGGEAQKYNFMKCYKDDIKIYIKMPCLLYQKKFETKSYICHPCSVHR